MSSLLLEVDVNTKRRIDIPLAISIPLDLVPPTLEKSPNTHGIGLVDTGASLSLVCEKVLRELQALPVGTASIVGIHGEPEDTDTYLIDLHFIHNEQFAWTIRRLEVAPLRNSGTIQVLIGMDVLTKHVREFRLIGSKATLQF
jgi:hypothetical protein